MAAQRSLSVRTPENGACWRMSCPCSVGSISAAATASATDLDQSLPLVAQRQRRTRTVRADRGKLFPADLQHRGIGEDALGGGPRHGQPSSLREVISGHIVTIARRGDEGAPAENAAELSGAVLKLEPVPKVAVADPAVCAASVGGRGARGAGASRPVPADRAAAGASVEDAAASSAGKPAPLSDEEIESRLSVALAKVEFKKVPLCSLPSSFRRLLTCRWCWMTRRWPRPATAAARRWRFG